MAVYRDSLEENSKQLLHNPEHNAPKIAGRAESGFLRGCSRQTFVGRVANRPFCDGRHSGSPAQR
jgi:CDGSH-type Zn-finger protein